MSSPVFAGQPKRPGIVGIIVGVALMVVLPIIGVILVGTSSFGAFGPVSAAEVISTADIGTFVDGQPGEPLGVYIDADGVAIGGQCQVLDPDGDVVTPSQPDTAVTYNDYDMQLIFTPTKAGQYAVMCLSDGANFTYKVAPAVEVGSFAGGLVAGILLIVLGGLVGLVLLIVTIVRRSRWTRKYGSGQLVTAPQMSNLPGMPGAASGLPGQPYPVGAPSANPVQTYPAASYPPANNQASSYPPAAATYPPAAATYPPATSPVSTYQSAPTPATAYPPAAPPAQSFAPTQAAPSASSNPAPSSPFAAPSTPGFTVPAYPPQTPNTVDNPMGSAAQSAAIGQPQPGQPQPVPTEAPFTAPAYPSPQAPDRGYQPPNQ
ncbi:MAG: hypothetical protein LBV30_07455 [Propionibacteriaceae bacterium]|jgi:hypothetical protein|nr:hypothetical protein [Propionibacteriaceae bacterium]